MSQIKSLLKAFELKDEKRTGSQLYSIEDPETVAGHSWSTALLVMIYGKDQDIDIERCLKMAIIHDLAEAETGDFLTRAVDDEMNFDKEEKERLERQFWEDHSEAFGDLRDIWEEYEERESDEAIFVKEMDLIELCITALKYERQGRYDPQDNEDLPYKHLDEFFESAEPRLKTDLGKRLFEALRNEYRAAKNEEKESGKFPALLKSYRLKDEKRTGWQMRNISDPETVAGHTWGVALLTFIYGQEEISNLENVLKIAVIHDLGESETGDIAKDAVDKKPELSEDEKEEIEEKAVEEICEATGLEKAIWDDYEDRDSEEARFVKDMDIIDKLLQALKYERQNRYDKTEDNPNFQEYDNLDEFFVTSEPYLQTEKGKQLFKEIKSRYEEAKQQ